MRFASYELLVNWLAAANYEKLYWNNRGAFRFCTSNRVLESAIPPGPVLCPGSNHRGTLISNLETGENLYSRALIRDVTSRRYDADMEAARQARQTALWRKEHFENLYGKNFLGFRNGPVPTTGSPCGGYFFRHVRTFPVLRDAADPDGRAYVRAKRRFGSYPILGGTISRAGAKSWKDTTRNRKQWMRGVKNSLPSKGKGLYVGRPETRRRTDFFSPSSEHILLDEE